MAHARRFRLAAIVLAGALAAAAPPATAQHAHPMPSPGAAPGTSLPPGHHGTPPGWTFTLPKGDAARGRAVFSRLECYACHEVRGESFPAATATTNLGPELAQMGAMHPPEFFAESVVNPSAVSDAPYRAPDGSSRMPAFNDSMTVQELIDLVAYLAALRLPAPTAQPHRHQPSAGGGGGG